MPALLIEVTMEVPNVELRSNELDLAVRALVEENILQEYHTEDETEVIEAYLPDGVEVIQVSPEEEGKNITAVDTFEKSFN